MKHIISAILVLTALQCYSQKPVKKEKIHFSSINTIGISTGTSGESMYLQTINGIRYKSWNFGVGTGIDWCGTKSVPLLADIRKTFTNDKHRPFMYADGGINFPWGNNDDAAYTKLRYYNGFCAETGIGYNLQLKNQTALVLSAGFSYKHENYDQMNGAYMVLWSVPASSYTTYDYYYRRIVVRLGIKF